MRWMPGGGGGEGEASRRGARGGGQGRGGPGPCQTGARCPGPGAAVDLTLLADLRPDRAPALLPDLRVREAGAGGGSDAWGPPLLLEKDDRIVRTPRPGQPPHTARNGSSR